MRSLVKLLLIIGGCFAMTFIVLKLSGLLSAAQIEGWLLQAQELSPLTVGAVVALLLFIDFFIAVPTLPVMLLSGYFLGFAAAALASFTGIVMAGSFGYLLSRYYGDRILRLLLTDQKKQQEAVETFKAHGVPMILLSRAVPILPEVTICLSGMTQMRFAKFMAAWLASAVPYLLIASYAGSISSIADPQPAIYAAIGLTAGLWLAWFSYRRLRISASR